MTRHARPSATGPMVKPAPEGRSGGGGLGGLAARVEAQTGADRDRYLDFLRVAAILMVIFGHWIVRVVVAPGGAPEAGYLLELRPSWQSATLIWQVMPLIFMVGGALNAGSWRRARADGVAPVGWIRRRARRLLRPTLPLLLVVVPAWLAADLLFPRALLIDPGVALIPLWFVAAYLAVLSLTPATLALHERGWSVPAIATAVVVAALVDVARLAGIGPVVGTQPLLGLPNFLLIWVAIHQLGHLWADDRLPVRPAGQAGMAVAGAAALVLLIGVGGWPLTMVPVEGTTLPNNAAPPTIALFSLALVQTGLALLARHPLRRALRRPLVWAGVALTGSRMMTLFLWHQLAMVVVTNLAVRLAWLPLAETIGARWWAHQPLLLLAFAVALAGCVAAAGRFEDAGGAAKGADGGGWGSTLLGIALVASAVAGLLWLGVAELPPALGLIFLIFFAAGLRALDGMRGRTED
ncbi:acyltransferase family protein [Pararhodobacter sp. SW119]|uniref:acyltransferase family protein n=1 Tax=Pararhodobacter sp. SW119 TaxID=2780075 RepID=UPI001ADF3EEF|nr:acyltransferase family protein [Pararhodobacter sp. SW119]